MTTPHPAPVTAAVSEPTPIPERPTLYVVIYPNDPNRQVWTTGTAWTMRDRSEHAASKVPGSIIATIPGSAAPVEKPAADLAHIHACECGSQDGVAIRWSGGIDSKPSEVRCLSCRPHGNYVSIEAWNAKQLSQPAPSQAEGLDDYRPYTIPCPQEDDPYMVIGPGVSEECDDYDHADHLCHLLNRAAREGRIRRPAAVAAKPSPDVRGALEECVTAMFHASGVVSPDGRTKLILTEALTRARRALEDSK